MGRPTEPNELQETRRPEFEIGEEALTVVDLFAGCGGLTLGAAQAAHHLGLATDVRLAVDMDAAAAEVYSQNFPKAQVETALVDDHLNGKLGGRLTKVEKAMRDRVGDLHLLVGGPPCQGHSDLNNYTRRDDPKNALYTRMARAAEVLRPRFVLIENVPAVRHAITGVVAATRAELEKNGYGVAEATVSLHTLGVAQSRRRHILLASRSSAVDPTSVLASIGSRTANATRHVRWAIGDLQSLKDPTGYDSPPNANEVNRARMQYLLDHELYDLPNSERPPCHQNAHSYKSMYGRLRWDLPAQTITSGFGSIGQGRYMHPSLARALTSHEAARLQGFPDYFDFSSVQRRTDLATMIGNAVPPPLSREITSLLVAGLGPGQRPG